MTYDDMDKQKKIIQLPIINIQNSIKKISHYRSLRKETA
jgi:hypothetical protein